MIKAGADLNDAIFTSGQESGTPLYAAASKGKDRVVRLLIDAGCDVDKKADLWYTPLFGATNRGYSNIVDMLLAAGADVNASGWKGITALHTAATKGYHALVVKLLKYGVIYSMRVSVAAGRRGVIQGCLLWV